MELRNVIDRARFRLGATSFVYPAGWVDNVERLAGRVRDIELLLFEAHGLPDDDEIAALARLASAGHSYTVHTPLSASLASLDPKRRARGVAEVVAAIERTRSLEPHGWIVHAYLGDAEGEPLPDDLERWRQRAARSLAAVADAAGHPRRICVETIDYDFDLIEPVVAELDLAVAWDIGHFYRDGVSWRSMLAHLDRVSVIQWHGTDPADRDHRSLRHVDRGRVRGLLEELVARDYRGVVTLEVFREDDFEESLAIVTRALESMEGS